MKKLHKILLLTLVGTLLGSLHAAAQTDGSKKSKKNADDVVFDTWAPVQKEDVEVDSTIVYPHYYTYHTRARGYNDRIVVRWMPDEYIPLRFLYEYGATLIRTHEEGARNGNSDFICDTLALSIKPLSLDDFVTRFGAADTLAAAAAQTVYGRSADSTLTKAPWGSMASLVEQWEQQQELFGYAAMVAEQRPDLAEAMGLGYTDRTAKADVDYTYYLKPNIPDSLLLYNVTMCQPVRLGQYKPEKLEMNLRDSITPPLRVSLYWLSGDYSFYDIERRTEGGEWKKLNNRPYVYMSPDDGNDMQSDDNILFLDLVPEPAIYEYRVSAYDLFGDKTLPTDPHKVAVKDQTPPTAPYITHIEILRGDTTIHAQLFFDTNYRDEDLRGFVPFYNNPLFMDADTWVPLTQELINPTDTTVTVNVTGLASGKICIAATDWSGNISQSAPVNIDIADLKAPDAPTNLRYTTDLASGTVRLVWDAPEDDDVMQYQVLFANDSTHMFIPVTSVPSVRDTVFVDTLAMDVNQRYIYYKVKAIDYSTNESPLSEMLQVLRPSHLVPQTCHLDSAWQDKDRLYIRWIASNEAQIRAHYLYRREQGQKDWTLLRILNGDSVKAEGNRIYIEDRPRPSQERWEYAVETMTFSDISSGLSLVYSVKFNGYRQFACPATLQGDFLGTSKNETRLVWDVNGTLPDYDKWYWCIYRKGQKDTRMKFHLTAKKEERDFSDFLLREGEEAEYYITLMMPGVGESLPSNTVKVTYKK